ncbi:helix-turn-helix domain-containing protein [Sinorhizobium mexicanum]|nr:AraC family transcriptional regulator [Sinorhizobium mexicanum]MBP1881840.1 AraC-like DNA-binding protein [Sinorhizobium mexicanum]
MLGQSLASTFGMRAWGRYTRERVVHSTITEQGHSVAAIHQAVRDDIKGPTRHLEQGEDAYLITSHLVSNPAYQLWDGCRLVKQEPVREASIAVLDLRDCEREYLPTAPEGVHFYLSRPRLRELLEVEGDSGEFDLDVSTGRDDEELHGLALLFLPMLNGQVPAEAIYLGHLAMAVSWHVLTRYAGKQTVTRVNAERLSPTRTRKAKELLSMIPANGVTIEAIAAECGLPPARFAKAFERTCGMSPMKWARSQRIELSKHRLFATKLSLTEVAFECGFADQSHFTRSFSAATGLTPAAWRQARRGL